MLIKVAGATLNQIPFDWLGNERRIREAIELARQDHANLLCLPELCITGYGCEDVFFNPHMQERAMALLEALLPVTKGMIVTLGLPLYFQGSLFNATAVLANGDLVGFVPKKYLAGDGVHYEPRWFKAWPIGHATKVERNGVMYPIGDLHFDFSGLKVGFEICEEAWVAQRPGAELARQGVDVILNPSASHFSFNKFKVRQGFVAEGSRAFNVVYVYANLNGNEAGRIIFDGGVLIANGGQVVAQGERFTYKDALVTSSWVDLNRNRVNRSRLASFKSALDQSVDLCIEVDFKLPESNGVTTAPAPTAGWESSANIKEEEFSRAVALGLFDFARKSHQNGFVVSLSGGVDSAAVTLLARLALEFGQNELGFAGLKQKLKHIPKIAECASLQEMAALFLTTAYQSTENSSKDTLAAAEAVAKDAGATFYNWSVDSLVKDYLGLAEEALQEKLTWEKYDSTLQNIQARARGPSIWILANVKSALLIATSNRSEAAVGYATMDGDTCGGLSPIGGIDKNFLRRWAQWMADKGPEGVRSFPSFQKVLSKPPTAELRPSIKKQTDEDDLMPYEILDAIEKLAIRDRKSPLECLQSLQGAGGTSTVQLKGWVAKFFRLWCRNQWKRERYAPAFHLDDASLDPKTWCRFPILSSGMEEEISLMEAKG